jgi:2-polyprenyl-6-methoxyphenol hydroxylase-like FAD-dependent oxidoreductase
VRRRYEQLSRGPAGLLAIGDAVSRFNPVYGQGMTAAALQAQALSRCLAQGTHDLARRTFRAIARVVDNPWAISVGSDLRYPAINGSRPPLLRFFNWYVERLHRAAHSDVRLADAFMRVANLAVPPTSLLRPTTALRVLGAAIGGRTPEITSAHASVLKDA